jgi:hypothetical protein
MAAHDNATRRRQPKDTQNPWVPSISRHRYTTLRIEQDIGKSRRVSLVLIDMNALRLEARRFSILAILSQGSH